MSDARLIFNVKFSQPTAQEYPWHSAGIYPISYSFSPFQDASGVSLRSKFHDPCPAAEKIDQVDPRDHIAACDTLSNMELRRRYPSEASSHKNMLHRRDRENAIIHPQLYKFRSFLRILGPKPARHATLDRINNNDREYAPGKVRWADKRTQNSNKGDSLVFYDPSTNRTFSTSQLAGRLGVSSNTIRARRHRGWTDDEIINGKKRSPDLGSPQEYVPVEKGRSQVPAYSPRREMTWHEREFIRRADEYREERERYGTEAIVADLETLNETFADVGCEITEEQYEVHFRGKWPDHRPHLDYFNGTLPESQKNLIAKIDPAYVRRVTAAREAKENLRNAL
ncbi:hypothetical protein [Rhizobium ruizarguesonis]|uniref:hypothetical protein n=1 Tax=Rhizobium ruizarguesonis TaxID=2081791 RepID=UPI0010308EE9|nr:hypothetical protein [Rhizobium ruizarguesonis]TBA91099.1 hypothetical protein ELH54_15315 [Rhizobium ruizarguesonis]